MIGDLLNRTTLQQIVLWVVAGGGGGVIAYWLLENVPWLVDLDAKPRRFVSIALTVLVGFVAYGVSVAMNYDPVPGDWREFVESAVALAAIVLGVSQAIHGQRQL